MKQSDARTAGRGVPPSFGRPEDPQEEDFSIRGGQAIHLVVHADVTPSAESLELLRATICDTTRQGVLDGYAAAFTEMAAAEPPTGEGGREQPA